MRIEFDRTLEESRSLELGSLHHHAVLDTTSARDSLVDVVLGRDDDEVGAYQHLDLGLCRALQLGETLTNGLRAPNNVDDIADRALARHAAVALCQGSQLDLRQPELFLTLDDHGSQRDRRRRGDELLLAGTRTSDQTLGLQGAQHAFGLGDPGAGRVRQRLDRGMGELDKPPVCGHLDVVQTERLEHGGSFDDVCLVDWRKPDMAHCRH